MQKMTQREVLDGMMKRPIPKKRIGIIRLEMVRESRSLYAMKRFTSPEEAARMVRPLLQQADRELVVVLSLNAKLEPLALEIAAVGGLDCCSVDVKNLFKHSLLNNAGYIMCFHNHPTGDSVPSKEDCRMTERIQKAGVILGIPLVDHIILGDDSYYSFREQGMLVTEGECEKFSEEEVL